jgi:mannan endo-1,4-beta-mannosidase
MKVKAFLFFLFFFVLFLDSNIALGELIYNGESAPFVASSSWDQNGSTLKESTKAPRSKPKHLRASITLKNWWGAVAYVPKNWAALDISSSSSLVFWAKAGKNMDLLIQLFDLDKKNSAQIPIKLTYNYQKFSIPTSSFTGVSLSKISAIIFAVGGRAGTSSYIVDIDDVAMTGSVTPPTPSPTPIPTPSPTPSPSPSPSPTPTPSPTPIPTPTPIPSGTTMKTNGRFLYDACGQKMVLRGMNHMTCWTDWVGTARDGMPMFAEMAKTGANVVRMSWITGENTTTAQLDAAITNAAANGLIPMPELHDYTCNWGTANITNVINFWTKPDMIAMIKKHQKYLLINFANEMSAPSSTEYIKEYTRAVVAMRAAGIHVPIVFDSSSCGQDENMIKTAAPALIQADPDHNLIFSLHIYWTDQNAARIAKAMTDVNALNIPMIIGEFSVKSVDCATPILWKEIIKQSQINQIGYLPWSWDHQNACADHSMTKDANQSFSTLWGWALELSVTDPYSIKNTSVRSQCF